MASSAAIQPASALSTKAKIAIELPFAAAALLVGGFLGGTALIPAAVLTYAAGRVGLVLLNAANVVVMAEHGLGEWVSAASGAVMFFAAVLTTGFYGQNKISLAQHKDSALDTAFQLVGKEFSASKDKGKSHQCIPYFAFAPWGEITLPAGEQCVDAEQFDRYDAGRFKAHMSINGGPVENYSFSRPAPTEPFKVRRLERD